MTHIEPTTSRKKTSTHRLQVTRGSFRYNVTLAKAKGLDGRRVGISWEVVTRTGKSRILGCGTSANVEEAQVAVARVIKEHDTIRSSSAVH